MRTEVLLRTVSLFRAAVARRAGSLPLLAALLAVPFLAGAGDPMATELSYSNGDVTLAATLTVPAGDGPFPALVIVHGSGRSDRSNAWTAAYATALTRLGIAVLHPDKRGSGQSGGDWRTAGFDVLAADVVAAVDALRAHPRLDHERIGLIGFSQGGHVVPLAATRSADVDFVVSVSASVVPLAEQIGDELRKMAVRDGLDGSQLGIVEELHQLALRYALSGEHWSAYADALAREKSGALAGKPVIDGFPDSPDAAAWGFLRLVGDFDPMVYWRQLQIPTLFIYGGRDQNVDVYKSADIIETQLTATELPYSLLLFRNNGHALYRDDALAFIAQWARDGGTD
jgi:uncharacterized protein